MSTIFMGKVDNALKVFCQEKNAPLAFFPQLFIRVHPDDSLDRIDHVE